MLIYLVLSRVTRTYIASFLKYEDAVRFVGSQSMYMIIDEEKVQ